MLFPEQQKHSYKITVMTQQQCCGDSTQSGNQMHKHEGGLKVVKLTDVL